MKLYENSTAEKVFLVLLKWGPFRETFQIMYDFRKTLTALTDQDESSKPKEDFLEDFWDFVAENLKTYKSKGGTGA
ncbi:MAG: hypothetical protein PWQ34_1393 [Caldanaerobacter sp.]|uniref:hypothetical protein n=1 Tax=Caldanaerobacter sp. TaxID=2930036 RepID=UPI0024AB9592|nr:hypothetical protein [Caldanaerobacter sp.]MDI3519246.1 hypothetical protein [Caldanaerobacter sp.]